MSEDLNTHCLKIRLECLGSNMAPVRNVLRYQQIAIQRMKNDENLDFLHFSTKILNGQLLKFLCYLCKGTYKNFLI